MSQLKLTVVSQEKLLVTTDVDQVTAPSSEGEITILPQHIPLFTKLVTGEFSYKIGNQTKTVIISQGFLTVSGSDDVMVIVDSATLEREISIKKAEEAIRAAQETITTSRDQQELIMAEASLRKALLEIKVAEKTKRTSI